MILMALIYIYFPFIVIKFIFSLDFFIKIQFFKKLIKLNKKILINQIKINFKKKDKNKTMLKIIKNFFNILLS